MIDVSEHLSKIAATEGATFNVMRSVLAEVTPKVTDLVRSIIMRKYNAAGMGTLSKGRTSTGKMASAIKSVSVRINMFGRKPSIVYSLPGNIQPYEGSKAPFYQVFMGQSYGSVRGAVGATKKDKKAIKKMALKGKDGIAGQYQKTGSVLRYADASGSIKAGSVVVTNPKEFWQMTNSEEAQVRALVSEEIDAALKRRR